jgi:hypothetical protein
MPRPWHILEKANNRKESMQQEPLQEHMKDRSAELGKLGGQIRMAQLDSQARSTVTLAPA